MNSDSGGELESTQSRLPVRVHRWLVPADAWEPASVEAILDFLDIGTDVAVLDPFCGGGTTPFVAAHRKHPTLSWDADPWSVLVTATKLFPPSTTVVEDLMRASRSDSLRDLIALADTSERVTPEHTQLARFCLFAGLERAGWDATTAFRETIHAILREIHEDCESLPRLEASSHSIEQADTFSEHLSLPRIGRCALITSAPFFGSIPNPHRLDLARRLRVAVSPGLFSATRTERAYASGLRSFITAVRRFECDPVAIEMGPGKGESEPVDWAGFVRRELNSVGYDVQKSLSGTSDIEPSEVVIGRLR